MNLSDAKFEGVPEKKESYSPKPYAKPDILLRQVSHLLQFIKLKPTIEEAICKAGTISYTIKNALILGFTEG